MLSRWQPACSKHTARIQRHQVFAVDTARGKTSLDRFNDSKTRLVFNDRGELLAICLTRSNANGRQPVPSLMRRMRALVGKRFVRLLLRSLLRATM
jgi:Transposase DDE domain